METKSSEVSETIEKEETVTDVKAPEEEETTESLDEEEVIHVSNTEEFLEAIAPGTTIFVEPGYYNMSEYLQEVQTWKGYDWDAEHPYVKLEYCYDGVEVVIKNADDLTIMGDAESLTRTEIVVEPRYAAVLTFFNCCDLNLSFLTMGHTETGACSGKVLNFYGCKNITLSAMDLYGCGVYAIETGKGTGDLYVYNSTLRDCSDGTLFMIEGVGNFEFRDCIFTGSYSGGYYANSADSELHFYNCIFGEEETNTWFFWPDIYAVDCTWSEVTQYPEYEYVPIFEPENMEEIPCDELYQLFLAVGWAAEETTTPEMLRNFNIGFLNSTFVISAWSEGKLVGCVRALSDLHFRSVILDLAVLPEYQNKGIGRELVQRCRNSCKDSEWLVQTDKAKGFYEKIGFVENHDYFLGISGKWF